MRKVGDEMANNKCKVMLTERNNLNCLHALPGPERTAAIQKKKKKRLSNSLRPLLFHAGHCLRHHGGDFLVLFLCHYIS